jgi:hypothetical protein
MPAVDEALGAPSNLASDLHAGIEAISANQLVTFEKYQRFVLPLDGYVFWVKVAGAPTRQAKGSLHIISDQQQTAEETYAINRVIFTSEEEIEDLNEVEPQFMWVGEIESVRFSFNSRGSFYKQALVYHYVGNAIYPDMETQIIDDPADLEPDKVIVSNSLPLWLALNGYVAPNPGLGFNMPTTMFPAFLTPINDIPPYAAVDIIDGTTEGVQAAPTLTADLSHYQLMTERVRITLWGLRNEEALQFIDCILAYSRNYDTFGIQNIPVIRDEKRTQSEMNTLAQKKSTEVVISYYQYTARDVARQLIETAQATAIPGL